MLMQDVVVFDVRPHGQRCGHLAAIEEDRGPGHARQPGLPSVQFFDEVVQRAFVLLPARRHERPTALPCGQNGEHGDADQQRYPGTVQDFGGVRRQEQQFDAEERDRTGQHHPQRFAPLTAGDVEEQDRRDRDGAGDRHPVRERERGRTAEREYEREHRDHQYPVDPRHVDLADGLRRGVVDSQSRQVPELHGLVRHRERAGDHRLRGDHGRRRGQQHHRQSTPTGDQQEERAGNRVVRVTQHERTLAQVAENARREDEEQPTLADRRPTEVSHVRIQRLRSGDRQDHRCEREEGDREVPHQEPAAYVGESASRICGCRVMPEMPHTAIVVNQTIITGPKIPPTRAEPSR